MRTIKGQTFASTAPDAHGEQCDKQFLLELVATMPARMPLNQNHDVGRPTVGYMENFRVEPDGDGWALKMDVTFEGDPPARGGFSFSTTQIVLRVDESPFSAFVPYPYYNDPTVLRELAEANPDASIGRWIKKSAEIAEVALVISIASLVLGPMWRKTYDEQVHPRLAAIVASVRAGIQRKNGGRAVRVDHLQPIRTDEYEGHIELYFIPSEHADTVLAYGFAVREATGEGMSLVKADWERLHKPIRRIVYVFEPDACRYRPTQIIYVDGDVRVP